MRLLLDTEVLLWAAAAPERLSADALALIEEPDSQLHFSAASIWELALRAAADSADDSGIDPGVLRRALVDNGYSELTVSASHAAALMVLPVLHRDPFGRMLVCQALAEGITLLTSDSALAAYPGSIRLA